MDSRQSTADAADDLKRARAMVMRRLAQSDRTRHELLTGLLAKGIPEDVANEVVSEFEDAGLVDDADYAKRFASARHREAGLSRRAITMKLRSKGVSEPLIEDAVAPIGSEDQREMAVQVALRRAPRYEGLETLVWQRRLGGYLQRKGYGYGDVLAAVAAVGEWLGDHGGVRS